MSVYYKVGDKKFYKSGAPASVFWSMISDITGIHIDNVDKIAITAPLAIVSYSLWKINHLKCG